MEKFNYETNGYNRKEVNTFINDVIVQTQDIIKKCQAQEVELDTLKKELDHYKTMEESLKQAMLAAEANAKNIKQLAQEEADMIVSDAKHNASRIVNEALLQAEKIEVNRELLEKNMKIFKRKLKLVMEEQKAVMEEIEILEIE